jgi:hypothetical protein
MLLQTGVPVPLPNLPKRDNASPVLKDKVYHASDDDDDDDDDDDNDEYLDMPGLTEDSDKYVRFVVS